MASKYEKALEALLNESWMIYKDRSTVIEDIKYRWPSSKLNPQEWDAVIQFYEDGGTLKSTALHFGISPSSVRIKCEEAGVAMRPSGGQKKGSIEQYTTEWNGVAYEPEPLE